MAGIYVHIPFCRKACRYCDFHFSVSLRKKETVIPSIIKEIKDRKEELKGETIDTIYFGGGTPSILEISEIGALLKIIDTHYNIKKGAEITFEANPDDLSTEYLKNLKKSGINRLSIGIQSFIDRDLELMRRSHDSLKAFKAIENSIREGFTNISIDLIYGLPGQDIKEWENNIDISLRSGIKHLSAYHLSYETGTIFNHWKKKGRISPVSEEESLNLFKILIKKTSANNFIHYEISNFALPGYISEHNSNYWKRINYLGFGPSAHSYDGKTRRWNISNDIKYVKSITEGKNDYYDYEKLTSDNLFNEYVITSLRTIWGIDTENIINNYGHKYLKHTLKTSLKYINSDHLEMNGNIIRFTEKGIFISDHIISDLIIV